MKTCDKISLVGVALFAALAIWNITEYIFLGEITPLIVATIISMLFLSAAAFAWQTRLSIFWLFIGVGSIILFACSNILGEFSNLPYMLQIPVSFIVGGVAIYQQIKRREKVKNIRTISAGFMVGILFISGMVWSCNVFFVNGKQGEAQTELWAVPDKFDKIPCQQQGKIEKMAYETKAYATDQRTVKKSAYVYLPYGYTAEKEYDILYLMHGTGDGEEYWLVKHEFNKIMLDNMIFYGECKPMIVVTPTWYVENDCENDLDKLTYSFKDELRNDLMPAVEGTYSTYAKATTQEAFINSRDHRAFAGLSRGSVTAFHAAMNGSLDYFSWFGCYSACRTSEEEFKTGIQSEQFKDYRINYFYNTSGSFDFMLKEHIQSYKKLIAMEERLTSENSEFDIFPTCYHSVTSWHIALYNSLQKFFKF